LYRRPESKPLQIFFIDVEGGQATLIVTPSKQSILIDTGWPGFNGRDAGRIVAAAKAAGVDQIDYVVITHFHRDHVGRVTQLASKSKSERLWIMAQHGRCCRHLSYAAKSARRQHLPCWGHDPQTFRFDLAGKLCDSADMVAMKMRNHHIIDLIDARCFSRGDDAARVSPLNPGHPVSIRMDCFDGVTISVACPPSTSMKKICRGLDSAACTTAERTHTSACRMRLRKRQRILFAPKLEK